MELLFISKKDSCMKIKRPKSSWIQSFENESANKIQSGYRPKIYTPVTNSLIHPFETSQRSVFVCFYFIFWKNQDYYYFFAPSVQFASSLCSFFCLFIIIKKNQTTMCISNRSNEIKMLLIKRMLLNKSSCLVLMVFYVLQSAFISQIP